MYLRRHTLIIVIQTKIMRTFIDHFTINRNAIESVANAHFLVN